MFLSYPSIVIDLFYEHLKFVPSKDYSVFFFAVHMFRPVHSQAFFRCNMYLCKERNSCPVMADISFFFFLKLFSNIFTETKFVFSLNYNFLI